MGAQKPRAMPATVDGAVTLSDGILMDNNDFITTAASIAPVTAMRKPFIQPDGDERVAQAGREHRDTLLTAANRPFRSGTRQYCSII